MMRQMKCMLHGSKSYWRQKLSSIGRFLRLNFIRKKLMNSSNSHSYCNSRLRQCLHKLIEGEQLTPNDIVSCMQEIVSTNSSPALVGAFLIALHFRSINAEILHYSASGMDKMSLSFPNCGEVLDIVGTGGDQHHTFNVSTAASILVSSVKVPPGKSRIGVAKHGNRSSSGRCGSADFIEALGARIELPCSRLHSIFCELKFAFLYAQQFHPSMRSIAQIRKELGIKTIFNYLGPLINPAHPSYMVVGVANYELGDLYADVFKIANLRKVMVVHSDDGLDEISPAGNTFVWIIENGEIEKKILTPEDFGIPRHSITEILGETPAKNVQIFRNILNGEKEDAVLDYLLMNAAAALVVIGYAKEYKEGVEMAREAITSKRAQKLIDTYIELTQKPQ